MEKLRIEIYTDGASSPHKTKSGGWGVVVLLPNSKLTYSGAVSNTTNNRMEMTAVLKAITLICLLFNKVLDKCEVLVYTDSMYVVNGLTAWRSKWEEDNNWEKIKNVDLWNRLYPVYDKLNINLIHVRGHAGNKYNEEADQLAVNALKEFDERDRDAKKNSQE